MVGDPQPSSGDPMPLRRALVAAAACLATAGCVGANAVDQTAGNDKGYVDGSGVRIVSAAQRDHAVNVRGSLLDGRTFDLASLRGKVVVVNFWSSSCPPCRAESDGLQAVADEMRSRGVVLLGVDIKDNRPVAEAFRRTHRVTYPSLYDPQQRVALQFRSLSPNAIPTTVILDRQGREAARVSGPVTYTQLRDLVARLAGEPA
jgi:peroxiredoxin